MVEKKTAFGGSVIIKGRKESLISCVPEDYIGFSCNEKMWPIIEKHECLLYADKVKKFQSSGWKNKQDRIILITTECVYNVKKDKVKRIIPLHLICGISKTNLGLKNEFTIHVPSQYDYRYQTERRDRCIDVL
jgi:hypothetical protein